MVLHIHNEKDDWNFFSDLSTLLLEFIQSVQKAKCQEITQYAYRNVISMTSEEK